MMVVSLFFMTLAAVVALSYLEEPPENLIVGTWKHHKGDLIVVFFNDGNVCFKIPLAQGSCEIAGKYKLMNRSILRIELDYQYGSISGEPIFTFTTPQILKLTIHEDKIIFYGLGINEAEEQLFIRVK